jgi:hypothetical protein
MKQMSDNQSIALDRNIMRENVTDELTRAAYHLVLRRGAKDSWLKLELCLWERLTETVERWGGRRPSTLSRQELKAWREGLLADLTESAYAVALRYGIKGSFLKVELGLYRVFRRVLRRHSRVRSTE